MKKLANKVAVITGGSSGIGLATAKKFVDEGAYVFITGRRLAELEKAAKEIGSNVTTVQGDIANLDDLDHLYSVIKKEKGRLDIVVANAAFVEAVPTAAVTPAHFDKTFDTNAKGSFFTVQKALPILVDGGAIVVVSSGAHQKGIAIYPTYSATKAAERSYVRTWAVDLMPRKIRVNTVSPGPIETPIIDLQFGTKENSDAMRKTFSEMTPMGRMGEAEEVANAILFLASSDSSFTTGADIPVDGGITQL
ncbi:SDR family NAD(P)-dependent oxidoreductase [Chitinophaga ginsengisoli]|uniref:NAD(P)-dependent dehydrogenase (Short-subunit alcohol dehydrogenase family) n=1 Tax=Chitinophaga ginsengisoli TaxID=363837 RepID=A0A2P8G583_9BACT|nr:SDR family oxidoreductase [Chitinophaga ginsengisoli]PSL29122.1 NAD(P)-dependent dehydrogenase (short-subunit alcohol dehydrogenase family) [Chitinophaga ginsengisoli]